MWTALTWVGACRDLDMDGTWQGMNGDMAGREWGRVGTCKDTALGGDMDMSKDMGNMDVGMGGHRLESDMRGPGHGWGHEVGWRQCHHLCHHSATSTFILAIVKNFLVGSALGSS